MASPITILSTEPSKSEDVVSLSETTPSTYTRVPTSWASEQPKFQRTNSNNSLTHIQKVTNWFKSINNTELESRSKAGYKCVVNNKNFNSCFTYDSSKPVIKRESGTKIYDCSSLCSYLDKCEEHESSNFNLRKNKSEKLNRHYDKSCTPDKPAKFQSVKGDISDTTSLTTESHIPLSPESQKKELCSYLKLMNPADKKQLLILQNRRSTRVKNLNFIHEMKEQETKHTKEYNNKKEKLARENLKITRTVCKNDMETLKEEPLLCFPKLPKKLTKKINDFDNVMRTNIRLYKIDKEKGEKQIYKLVDDVKVLVTKNKVIHINKENIKKLRKKKVLLKHSKQTKLRKKQISIPKRKKLRRNSQVPKRNFTTISDTGCEKPIHTNKVFETVQKTKESVNIKKDHLHNRPKSAPLFMRTTVRDTPEPEPSNLSNFISDSVDLNFLSDEHKKCILTTRMLSSNESDRNSLGQLSPLHGFKAEEVYVYPKDQNIEEHSEIIFKQPEEYTDKKLLTEENLPVETKSDSIGSPEVNEIKIAPKNSLELLTQIENQLCNSQLPISYLSFSSFDTNAENNNSNILETISEGTLAIDNPECIPFNDKVEVKSLHRSLNLTKRRIKNSIEDPDTTHGWVPDSPSQKQRKNQHYINVSKENGCIMKAFYIDYNLIICQKCMVSFWTQTALGNVLGAQNMWIQKGQAQRLVLNTKCLQKDSAEMVVSTENNVAYIELWMKEHKSELRTLPVADVFATVYFWKQRQTGLGRKVLQLENINGFSDDVQYLVLRWTPKIVVSWHSATNNELETKKTYIHCYELADDYQTVANISEIQAVEHYVSSLHTIEDCEELIMGCGENKITLWNVVYGYTVATIELTEINSPLSTLWVKCDRGFLFTLQQCVDRELRLIAINGINHKWKKLASYFPPEDYDRLKGVCIENGIVLSFYDQGIVCWNAHTSEPVVEETLNDVNYILSGNYVIIMANDQINVKHAITYLISPEDT